MYKSALLVRIQIPYVYILKEDWYKYVYMMYLRMNTSYIILVFYVLSQN